MHRLGLGLGLTTTTGSTGAASGSTFVGVSGQALTTSVGTVTATGVIFDINASVNVTGQSLSTSVGTVVAHTGATAPTTLQTSVSHGSATYNFSVPVRVGTFADGQPFAISDRVFNITSVTPDGASVASDPYTNVGVQQTPKSLVKNGMMVNPYLVGTTPQGFDGIIGEWADGGSVNGAATTTAYSAALNKDPAMAGAFSVAIGYEASLVKSVRTTGLTTPGPWGVFEDWCVLHIIATAPLAGSFAPGVSDLNKTAYVTTDMRDKSALGPGFAYSTGMPTLATCVAGEYFRPFQPFFGLPTGERKRPFMIDPSLDGYSGGVGGFGMYFADYFAALLAEGSDVSDTELNKALAFGATLIGLSRREGGGWGDHGAGHWNGHKQFAQLFGHVFHASVPGLMDECLTIEGNCVGQTMWVTSAHVGCETYWPANDRIYQATFLPEHVGLPWWQIEIRDRDVSGNVIPTEDADSDIGADYEFVSGPSSFVEMLNIMLLKNGPSGQDGSQVIARGGAWDNTNNYAACIAYYDRYRSFKSTSSPATYGNSQVRLTKSTAYWDDRRGDAAAPRWQGVPDAFSPYNPSIPAPTTYISPVSGGFSWDLSTIENTTSTVLEWQIQYSLDTKHWIDVTTQGVSGTQTGLTRLPHYVRHRRRSSFGWGPWSLNYPRAPGAVYRSVFTPTGTPANSAPNFTVTPKIYKKTYPAWQGPSWEDATGDTLTVEEVDAGIEASIGYVTGYPGPTITYQKRRAGTLVGSASSSPVIIDEAEDASLVISADVVAHNTSGADDTETTASVTWYGTASSYVENFVIFNGTTNRLRRSTNLTGVADNKKATFFFSVDFAAGPSGSQYIIASNGTTNRCRRESSGALNFTWGAVGILGTSISAERVNILVSADADATSQMVMWKESTGTWGTVTTDAAGGGVALDFTNSISIGSSDAVTGAGFLPANVARVGVWLGVAPDISLSSVRSNFSNNAGEGIDPVITNAFLGVSPIIDFYGLASTWNAGTHQGTGGTFTMSGTVVDVALASPVLTLPTGTTTGTTTATVGVTINQADGSLYTAITTSITPPDDDLIIAGTTGGAFDDVLVVTGTGTGIKTFSATGLADNTTYYAHFVQENSGALRSSVVTSASFTTTEANPVLTLPTGVATGSTTATIGVTIDTDDGNLYVGVTTSSTPPSDTSLIAGTAGGPYSSYVNVTGAGVGIKTFNATGLTASTNYYAHLVQQSNSSLKSSVVTSAVFTTTAGANLMISQFGAPTRHGSTQISALSAATIDATNECSMQLGRIRTSDGLSHTIDTTGSSSLQWRTNTSVWAATGTPSVAKIGLALVDQTVGPPGRAVATSDVINFSVSKTVTSPTGITTAAWNTHVPDAGTMTIANGDEVAFCVQITNRQGSDSIQVNLCPQLATGLTTRPWTTEFTGGVYASSNRLPTCIIVFSDGALGWFDGSYPASVGYTAQTWNNSSATKEYGNIIQLPAAATAVGFVGGFALTGDVQLVLYTDPLGTPVAVRTNSIDLNVAGISGNSSFVEPFRTTEGATYTLAANTPYGVMFKPTTTTNFAAPYLTLNSSAHQIMHNSGILTGTAYAASRASGAFAAQNSSKDRYAIGLLLGAV